MPGTRAKLAKGAVWLGAARVATNLFGFISTLVLARILTPDDFGLVALGTSLLTIVSAFTDRSLASALVQHKNPTLDHYHTTWSLGVARGLLVGGIFCAASWPIAAIYAEPRLINVMIALSFSIVLSGLANPRPIMMMKDLIFWQQFMMEVSQKLVGLIASIAIALVYKSYWALIVGTVAGQLSGVLLSYCVLPFRPKLEFRYTRDILSFSIWITLGRLINTVNWRFDHLIIGGYLGRPALGYYTVGNNLAVMPTRETMTPLTATLFPAFTRLTDSRERLASAYQSGQALITAIVLPIGVGMALIADPFVRLAMGEKWLTAVLVIQVLASVFAIQTLGSVAEPLAMATNNTKLLFMRDIQGFVMRLPFIIAGMLLAGLPGIIYARALTGFLGILLNMNLVKIITGLPFWTQVRANLRSLTSVAVMAGGVQLFEGLLPESNEPLHLIGQLAVVIVSGAAIYPTAHALLWVAGGRPAGPEKEVVEAVTKVAARMRSFARSAAADKCGQDDSQ